MLPCDLIDDPFLSVVVVPSVPEDVFLSDHDCDLPPGVVIQRVSRDVRILRVLLPCRPFSTTTTGPLRLSYRSA